MIPNLYAFVSKCFLFLSGSRLVPSHLARLWPVRILPVKALQEAAGAAPGFIFQHERILPGSYDSNLKTTSSCFCTFLFFFLALIKSTETVYISYTESLTYLILV